MYYTTNIWIFYHIFFSYLITEILILECLVQVIKKISGMINNWVVQISIGERLVKNSIINKWGGTFMWNSKVIHVVFKKMSFPCNSYGINSMTVTTTVP